MIPKAKTRYKIQVSVKYLGNCKRLVLLQCSNIIKFTVKPNQPKTIYSLIGINRLNIKIGNKNKILFLTFLDISIGSKLTIKIFLI